MLNTHKIKKNTQYSLTINGWSNGYYALFTLKWQSIGSQSVEQNQNQNQMEFSLNKVSAQEGLICPSQDEIEAISPEDGTLTVSPDPPNEQQHKFAYYNLSETRWDFLNTAGGPISAELTEFHVVV